MKKKKSLQFGEYIAYMVIKKNFSKCDQLSGDNGRTLLDAVVSRSNRKTLKVGKPMNTINKILGQMLKYSSL